MSPQTEAFLKQYESAVSQSDVSAIAAHYSDVFMFGGPRGAQSVKKDDFLKMLPKRREWFLSIGLVDSKVTFVDENHLDSKYSLVKTVWTMTFKKAGVKHAFDLSATYILEWNEGTPRIVFQIDHQDLTAVVKHAGLA